MPRTYNEQMQEIVRKYKAAREEWPATLKQIAAWALYQDLWAPQQILLITKCAEDLGRALREEYITDPQGRRVRAKHAARMDRDEGEQGALWDDIRTAPHEHMQLAFQQRRQGIVGDCHRLRIDVESYNDNRNPIEPIQMSFDFTNDVLEMEMVAA
jgi:hypothetical protein